MSASLKHHWPQHSENPVNIWKRYREQPNKSSTPNLQVPKATAWWLFFSSAVRNRLSNRHSNQWFSRNLTRKRVLWGSAIDKLGWTRGWTRGEDMDHLTSPSPPVFFPLSGVIPWTKDWIKSGCMVPYRVREDQMQNEVLSIWNYLETQH